MARSKTNSSLIDAKKAKKDEFYTQLSDIENELRHYKKHFKDKVVFCNCDDPYESNFFKYFALNFNHLGLKKLIATCYSGSPITGTQLSLFGDEPEEMRTPYKAVVTTVHDTTGEGGLDMFDVAELFRNGENQIERLKGDGDFRSPECVELLKEADIVVTNPPFSLFREYVALLIQQEKQFLVIGSLNAITYKDFFPLLKNNRVWIGFCHPKVFIQRDGSTKAFGNIEWFTNLDHDKRHEPIPLYKRYSPEEFPKYVNYDAVDVGRTEDIPFDYKGEMGVPISFLNKYCPEQFEIIGVSLDLATPIKTIAKAGEYMGGGNRFYSTRLSSSDIGRGYKYHREYDRIVIRHKNPEV